jgi:hypothetical protein
VVGPMPKRKESDLFHGGAKLGNKGGRLWGAFVGQQK